MIMILGMDLLTFVHVALSLVGIFTGFVVVAGMMGGRRLDGWTAVFLFTTIATSVTAFMFPFTKVTPGIILAVISLVVLAVTLLARYALGMVGVWRRIYAITAVIALYLNVFVLIAQSFMKIPALHALAPTGSEPPFAIAQGVNLVLFIVLGVLCAIRFRV
jgi:hypothetical protein